MTTDWNVIDEETFKEVLNFYLSNPPAFEGKSIEVYPRGSELAQVNPGAKRFFFTNGIERTEYLEYDNILQVMLKSFGTDFEEALKNSSNDPLGNFTFITVKGRSEDPGFEDLQTELEKGGLGGVMDSLRSTLKSIYSEEPSVQTIPVTTKTIDRFYDDLLNMTYKDEIPLFHFWRNPKNTADLDYRQVPGYIKCFQIRTIDTSDMKKEINEILERVKND